MGVRIAAWLAVSDMSLGRLAGLYAGTVWFDKVLHFGNSLIVGLLAFLIVYALRFTGRLQSGTSTLNGAPLSTRAARACRPP